MARRISLLSTTWANIKKTLAMRKQKQVIVGTDYNHNIYYEKLADEVKNFKGSRWVEPADGDQWKVPEVPAEWNAWLRGLRKEPPTDEEIERNYVKMVRTQQRAMAFEAETQGDASDKPLPAPTSARQEFPKYEEYEQMPGEFVGRRKKDR